MNDESQLPGKPNFLPYASLSWRQGRGHIRQLPINTDLCQSALASTGTNGQIFGQHLRGLKPERTSFLSVLQVLKNHILSKQCSSVGNEGSIAAQQVAVLETLRQHLLTTHTAAHSVTSQRQDLCED